MNIAILIPALVGGGAERIAQTIGDYYVEKGNKVYYFLKDKPERQAYPVKGQIVNTGIKSCLSEVSYGNIQILFRLVNSSFKMRKQKRKYNIDVAISFMEEFNYLNVLSKGKEKVITRVCTILSGSADYSGILYNKNIIRFFYNKADKVIVPCNDAAEDMHNVYKVSMKKIVKIPNPVLDVPNYKAKFDWKYGDKVIITVGRLIRQKQHDRIIRAFSYVKEHEKKAKLLILGAGSREKHLKYVCRKNNLEKDVIFAGFKKDVAEYLQNSKVFVMASEVEGMPNSMLEAMVNGVPVVTTDSPGACGELVGKKKNAGMCKDIEYYPYGILTPYIHGEAEPDKELDREEFLLGKAMLMLLENDGLREKYSRRSRKRASMYNIEKIMKMWNKLW